MNLTKTIMRRAAVFFKGKKAGVLIEERMNFSYLFRYDSAYSGEPVSLTLPVEKKEFRFESFPSYFDGLLPEGVQLDGLLRSRKIDRYDYFSQLVATGSDLVGAVTILETDEQVPDLI